MSYYQRIVTIAVFLCAATGSWAQDTLKKYPLDAVLVQLPSEYNRINAMQKRRMYHEMEKVQKDGEAVRAVMINDFQLNFKKAPVYYFIDTNIDRIQEKKFAGILLDETEKPVQNPVINSGSTDYLVVYYGFSKPQSKMNKVATDSEALYGDSYGRGLVVLNSELKQVNYFYKLETNELFSKKRTNSPIFYKSKDYDIEYYPFAKMFNDKLLDRYGKRRLNADKEIDAK